MAKIRKYLDSSDFRVTYDVPLAEKGSLDIRYESSTINGFHLSSLNSEDKDSCRKNTVNRNSVSSTDDSYTSSSESSSPSDPISISSNCSAWNHSFGNETHGIQDDKKFNPLDSKMTVSNILLYEKINVKPTQSENSLTNHIPPDFTSDSSQIGSWTSDSDHSDSGVDLGNLHSVDNGEKNKIEFQLQQPTSQNNSTFVNSDSEKSIITSVDNENTFSDMLSSVCLNINDNLLQKSNFDASTAVQKNCSNISRDSLSNIESNNIVCPTVAADSNLSDLLSSLCFDDEDNMFTSNSFSEESNIKNINSYTSVKDDACKLVDSSTADSSLSDLLSSLCFDDENNMLTNNSISEESNILKSINISSSDKKDPNRLIDSSTVKAEFGLSDLLSSICFNDDSNKFSSYTTSEDSSILKNIDFCISGKEDINESSASKNLFTQQISNLQQTEEENEISLADLALEHLSSSQPTNSLHTVFNQADVKFLYEGEENVDLKNYCNFSATLKTCQSDCSIDNLSMHDVLAEVNSVDKNSECSKEDCIDTVQLSIGSSTENIFLDDAVDLTSCLKSCKTLSVAPSNVTVVKDSFVEYSGLSFLHQFSNFEREENEIILQARKSNTKQSLFAKALSCKPRKDRSVIDKVTYLQETICNNLFNPSKTTVGRYPAKEKCQTTHCAVASLGRRIFGPNIPCEIV